MHLFDDPTNMKPPMISEWLLAMLSVVFLCVVMLSVLGCGLWESFYYWSDCYRFWGDVDEEGPSRRQMVHPETAAMNPSKPIRKALLEENKKEGAMANFQNTLTDLFDSATGPSTITTTHLQKLTRQWEEDQEYWVMNGKRYAVSPGRNFRRGIIQVEVAYASIYHNLTITVVRARDLPTKMVGDPAPYVQVRTVLNIEEIEDKPKRRKRRRADPEEPPEPPRSREPLGPEDENLFSTDRAIEGREPLWEQNFIIQSFPLNHLFERDLLFTVHQRNSVGKDSEVGEARFVLNWVCPLLYSNDARRAVTAWLNLGPTRTEIENKAKMGMAFNTMKDLGSATIAGVAATTSLLVPKGLLGDSKGSKDGSSAQQDEDGEDGEYEEDSDGEAEEEDDAVVEEVVKEEVMKKVVIEEVKSEKNDQPQQMVVEVQIEKRNP